MHVWDGTSGTRSDPTSGKSPDGKDWKTITRELQKTQTFVTNLASNVDAMPDLLGDIKKKQEILDKLQQEVDKLTAPEDVVLKIEALEKKFNTDLEEYRKIHAYASEVLRTVNIFQRQLSNLGRRVDKHIEDSLKNHKSFENKASNWQRTNEARWMERLDTLENQLGEVSLAFGLENFGE
jgi:DNA repair ATPase RecN